MSEETKQCPFCAETIKAAAIVCRYCGRDLIETDPPHENAEGPVTEDSGEAQQQSKTALWITVALLVGIVAICLITFQSCSGGSGSTSGTGNQSNTTSCPKGTLAVHSSATCYTTSDSDNGEYVEKYPKGAVVISSGVCEGRYVRIKAGCWINKSAVTELD